VRSYTNKGHGCQVRRLYKQVPRGYTALPLTALSLHLILSHVPKCSRCQWHLTAQSAVVAKSRNVDFKETLQVSALPYIDILP
jgi:hypothetical protein